MQQGPRKRDLALQGGSFLLALGVGVLIGARACTPEPEVGQGLITKEILVDKIVYECPPDPSEELLVPAIVEASDSRKNEAIKKALPKVDDRGDPLRRKRLLAWVRDASSSLRSCNTTSSKTHRTAVTLRIGSDGEVKRVSFEAPPSEIPTSVRSCLRREMKSWVAPVELTLEDERLVFGLTI